MSLQCFDAVGWVTGMSARKCIQPVKKSCYNYSKILLGTDITYKNSGNLGSLNKNEKQ